MILLDVNVLVYACRRDADGHLRYHRWLADTLSGPDPVGVAPESLGALVRITTNARVWKHPLPVDDALAFAEAVRSAPACIAVQPGDEHWELFASLCRSGKARGNLVSDAWLAALAIEHGCTLVTTDRGFGRFKGLRWRGPFE